MASPGDLKRDDAFNLTLTINDNTAKMSKTRQQAEESANAGESEDEDSQLVSARVYEQIQWAIGFQVL